MQAVLSFENAPPFAAPLRFFLTAPVFGLLAAVLLVCEGPSMLLSRWGPATLAATHLLTVGFMLQIMLGALIQILPVVAGANLPKPLRLAQGVHGGLTLGGLLLAAGFLLGIPSGLVGGAVVLAASILLFLVVAGGALFKVPPTSPTIRGVKLALVGLLGVITLGAPIALALAHGWALPLPMAELVDLHAGWGLGGWGGVLLAALSFVVVPMFQLTPGYPARPSWGFPVVMCGALLGWSLALLFDLEGGVRLFQGVLALAGGGFVGLTLNLQRQRRRARADATYRYWQLGLGGGGLALFMLLAATIYPPLGDVPGWSLLFGVLLIVGGFMPMIIGMLYKIIPFLAWMHLQNLGQAKVMAPSMNKLLLETEMQRQMWLYVAALALLAASVFLPAWLARPAGAAFVLACASLWWNLFRAVRRYQAHRDAMLAKLAEIS